MPQLSKLVLIPLLLSLALAVPLHPSEDWASGLLREDQATNNDNNYFKALKSDSGSARLVDSVARDASFEETSAHLEKASSIAVHGADFQKPKQAMKDGSYYAGKSDRIDYPTRDLSHIVAKTNTNLDSARVSKGQNPSSGIHPAQSQAGSYDGTSFNSFDKHSSDHAYTQAQQSKKGDLVASIDAMIHEAHPEIDAGRDKMEKRTWDFETDNVLGSQGATSFDSSRPNKEATRGVYQSADKNAQQQGFEDPDFEAHADNEMIGEGQAKESAKNSQEGNQGKGLSEISQGSEQQMSQIERAF